AFAGAGRLLRGLRKPTADVPEPTPAPPESPSKQAAPPTEPEPTPGQGRGVRPTEQELRDLGTDPATGRFRPSEAEAAARLQQKVGPLKRDPSGNADWIGQDGTTYDAVGPVPKEHFDPEAFNRSIDKHFLKQGLDKIVVDTTGLTPEQQVA